MPSRSGPEEDGSAGPGRRPPRGGDRAHGTATLVVGHVLDGTWVSRLARLTGARSSCRLPPAAAAAASRPPGRTMQRPSTGPAELTLAVGSTAVDPATLLRTLLRPPRARLLLALVAAPLCRGISRPVKRSAEESARQPAAHFDTAWPRAAARCRCSWTLDRMTEDLGTASPPPRAPATEQAAAWEAAHRPPRARARDPARPAADALETLLAARKARDPRIEAFFVESTPAMLEEGRRLPRTIDAFAPLRPAPRSTGSSRLDLARPGPSRRWASTSGTSTGVTVHLGTRPPLPVPGGPGCRLARLHDLLPEHGEGDALRDQ